MALDCPPGTRSRQTQSELEQGTQEHHPWLRQYWWLTTEGGALGVFQGCWPGETIRALVDGLTPMFIQTALSELSQFTEIREESGCKGIGRTHGEDS